MQKVSLLLTCNFFFFEDLLQFQLVNGSGRCSGGGEVSYHGQWGRVCEDHWDMHEAKVVCQQLSWRPALAAPVKAHFAEGEGQFLLDDVDCTGRQSFLGPCPHADWYIHICGPGEDASVVCSVSSHLSLQGCTCHHPDSISTNPSAELALCAALVEVCMCMCLCLCVCFGFLSYIFSFLPPFDLPLFCSVSWVFGLECHKTMCVDHLWPFIWAQSKETVVSWGIQLECRNFLTNRCRSGF